MKLSSKAEKIYSGINKLTTKDRCISIGEKTGLYKDEIVAKNCVPAIYQNLFQLKLPN